MKKIFNITIAITCILLLAWTFRFQILEVYFKGQKNEARDAYFKQSPESKILNSQKKILEDIKILSTYPLFTNSQVGSNDAAPFLNSKVSWTIGSEKKKKALAIPDEVLELLSSKSDFNELTIDWEKFNLDFSFFQNIHQYDFWSYDTEEPFPKNLTNLKMEDIPQVDYFELINWSKLRVLHGRDHNELDQAIKDISHLAKLIMSNDNSMSNMAAIAVLKVAAKTIQNPEMTSKTIPIEHLEVAKRFFWAQESFLDLRLTPNAFGLFSETPVGLCSRINDTISSVISYRRLLDKELSTNLERLGNLITKTASTCRSSYARRAWADSEFKGFLDEENSPSGKITAQFGISVKDLENHPQLAASIGFLYISIASLDKMKDYE